MEVVRAMPGQLADGLDDDNQDGIGDMLRKVTGSSRLLRVPAERLFTAMQLVRDCRTIVGRWASTAAQLLAN